jgi:hypothetical protein
LPERVARLLTCRSEQERAMILVRQKYWPFQPIFALGRILTGIGVMRDQSGFFEMTFPDEFQARLIKPFSRDDALGTRRNSFRGLRMCAKYAHALFASR